MTDRQRMHGYWLTSLFLLASSPVLGSFLFREKITFHLHVPYLIISPFAVMLAVLILELFLSIGTPHGKIWLKEPTVTIEQPVTDFPQWQNQNFNRLQQSGFAIDSTDMKTRWEFSKEKADAVHSFEDRAFSGVIEASHDLSTINMKISLTLKDILLVETGEIDNLRRLAMYLAGSISEYRILTLPLTLRMSLILCIFCHLAGYVECFSSLSWAMPVYETSFLSVGSAIWIAFIIYRRPKELLGLRIALTTVLAGSTPLTVLFLDAIVG